MRMRPSRSRGSARVAIITRSAGGRTVQQAVDVGVDGLVDLVEVVEHEHERLLAALQRVGERGHEAVRSRGRVRGERTQRLTAAGTADRMEHRPPEARALGVAVSSETQATESGAPR